MNPCQTWDYEGFTVWEGLRSTETDRWQYFFVISKEGERKFTYCVWVEKETWSAKIGPEGGTEEEALQKALPLMREKGLDRVKGKITKGDLTSAVLRLEGEQPEEILLNALGKKLQ